MECGSYRGIKLLEHAMKVVERIFQHRIRQQIKIDDMQFGFMKGIFMARQMQENFRVKGKKLYFGFVDLEKAFDRVPREVISWAMRKLGVEEWLVSAVMSMYSVYMDLDHQSLILVWHPWLCSQLVQIYVYRIRIVWRPYLENLGLPCHGNCCMLMTWQ